MSINKNYELNTSSKQELKDRDLSYFKLQATINLIKESMEKSNLLESKINTLQQDFNTLTTKLSDAKLDRDMVIGQNYTKLKQSSETDTEQNISSLEDTLVKVKLDHGKLSEQVIESEDIIEYYINSCKECDSKIKLFKKELDKIKIITPPAFNAPQTTELSSCIGLKPPIQLNSKKAFHIRKSESMHK